jgi:hypothetical protein
MKTILRASVFMALTALGSVGSLSAARAANKPTCVQALEVRPMGSERAAERGTSPHVVRKPCPVAVARRAPVEPRATDRLRA